MKPVKFLNSEKDHFPNIFKHRQQALLGVKVFHGLHDDVKIT